MRIILALLALSIPAVAGSRCWAIANITTVADWKTTSKWASTVGGSGGTCAAAGGGGLPIYGNTETLPAGVPGAAGAGDFVGVKTGVVVRVAAGLGVELGTISANTAPAVEVNATDATTYGAFLVDSGGLASLKGNSNTTSPLRKIDRYAVFQVMPGGWTYNHGNTGSAPADTINGRVYVGCDDQTSYPSPFCTSGTAGIWVTPSVASTLNFTAASTLPSYIAVSDLVELDRVPQQVLAYPYTAIDGATPPPPFPNMPTTNDTGSSPMRTCGSLATCLVPDSTPLCVVAISGTSVSLGWPQGGTAAVPYCTGAETALAITDVGSGRLWLKKPAFFWGLASDFVWNTARTKTFSSTLGNFDSIRSAASLGVGPVSNVAGDGPGRAGDNSLSITGSNFNAPCTALRIEDITSANQQCFVDYARAAIYAYGRLLQFTASASFTTPITPTSTMFAGFSMGISTDQSYAEMVFGNVDIQYLFATTSQNAVITLRGTDNTANHRVGFRHATVRMCGLLLGAGSNTLPITADTSHQVEITENAVFAGSGTSSAVGNFGFVGTAQNVDVSRNFFDDWHSSIYCKLTSTATFSTFTHVTATHNMAMTESFFGDSVTAGATPACQWPGALVQQNRVQGGQGAIAPLFGPWAGSIMAPHNKDANSRITIRYNFFYGIYRMGQLQANTDFSYNVVALNWHHLGLLGENENGAANSITSVTLSQNVTVDHNVMLMADNATQTVACWELGYNEMGLIDNPRFYNNTCAGMALGGFGLGDLIDSSSSQLIVALRAHDNIFATVARTAPNNGAGFSRNQFNTATSGPIMMQSQRSYVGNNSMQGTLPITQGAPTPSVNSIPNPDYGRNAMVAWAGGNYNIDPARTIAGVAIQNPSYSVNKTGAAMKLIVTSLSSMTLAWAVNGSSYGAAEQLNWAGAGTTYTVSSQTDPGAVFNFSSVTVGGTPFVGMGATNKPASTSCPTARWLIVVSATTIPAGTAYAIASCGNGSSDIDAATGRLNLVPRESRWVAGDVVAVIKAEARLMDVNGTDYVDAGIDARSVPNAAATYTDTGISLSLTDYCSTASTCASGSVVSGLPTTITSGVSNSPLIPLSPPWAGGSAEQAFTGPYYVPAGVTWKTASTTGSYIGAVAPPTPARQWVAFVGAWSGLYIW